MRGIILFVVIVTVSSVRSLHPQPKGENNRVKGGTPVSSNFDRNSLGPTKTKKGKRPSRIGNIDVNFIRTIGADIALRKNAQNSDSVSVDVNQNNSPVYLSSLQKGEPPGYNKNDSYISTNNADGSNYKTNRAMLANSLNIYSSGGTQSSANIGINNYNDGGYLSPEFHPPVMNRDSKPEYQARIQPKSTSWKSLQQKNLSDKIDYQFRQEKNTAKQSKSQVTLRTFSSQNNKDQAYDPWKPDFGIPDKKEYTNINTKTGGVKAASYDKVDNTNGLYLSPQKDVSKQNSIKTANNYDTRSEKLFNLKNNYQVSKKTDETVKKNNQSPNKPSYDFGRPDRPEVSKPKYSDQTTGKGSIKVVEKPDLLKPNFNRPDQSDNNGYKQPTKQVKQTDMQNQIKVGKNKSIGKTSTSNDYSNKDNQNAKIVLDTFKTLYQAKFTKSGNKPTDLSKPDFNRPDKSDPSKVYRHQDKPSYDFGRPDKPSYISKSDFKVSQNIAYQKDVNSQTITNGKSLNDFGKPDQPDQKKPRYKKLGKPDFSTPDFNRPDTPFNSKQKPDFFKPDFSRNENTPSLKQDYSQQIKVGIPDVNKPNYDSIIKSSTIIQEKPDFNRPDKPDTTKQDYNTPQNQVKPSNDFGKPKIQDQNKPSNKKSRKIIVVKQDINNADKLDKTKQGNRSDKQQIKSSYNFGKADMPDQIKPIYQTASKSFEVKAVKSDIVKSDFIKPDKPETSKQDFKPQKQVKSKYDFGRPDMPDQTKLSYKSAGKKMDVKTANTDISKPDFNRPDKPDTLQQDYKQPKPAYDFGRPDVPDKIKLGVKSAGKIFAGKEVKSDVSKPDFNRPDKPDVSIQRYNKQLKQASSSYDFSRTDKSVKTQQKYQQVDNLNNKDVQKSYISKPDFKRPDQPDITKQDYIPQIKRVKPMYDFGKPDGPEQNKPYYESAGKPVVIKPGKPDIFKPDFNRQEKSYLRKQTYKSSKKQRKQTNDFRKPDFNRPDQPDITIKDFKTPTKQIEPTYDFGKPDVSVQYEPSYKSAEKLFVVKPSKPDTSKPDFNGQDKPNVLQQDFKQAQKLVKPTYDFGKPDVPDQYKTSYDSAGKPVVKYNKPDVSKPDFNRPDKPDAANQGNNKQMKVSSVSYDFSQIDRSSQFQQKYQQGDNRNAIGLQKPDISKPDFNRPDQPDITKQDYKTPAKLIKPTYDFGKPDVPVQYKPSFESAGKRFVVKPGMPDISKPDFNRPDKPGTTKQDYKQPRKQTKPAYDFGKPDVPDQFKPSYKSNGIRIVETPMKPDISKPDFNKPDKLDTSKQDYKQPQTKVKPTYDFGKPDQPDQNKPNYQSAGKPVVKYNKPDVSKPDFNRPDSPDASIKGYNNQPKVDSTSYDLSSIDKSVKVQQSYKKDVNRNTKGLYKFDISKPDFNRPDQPDFNRPDKSKPNFNKPDKLDTSQQVYKQPQKQIKPTYDFGRPDVPDQIKPRYKSGGKTFVLNKVKSDISKPDFNRPDKPDTLTQGNNQQPEPTMTSYEFRKIDQTVQTRQNYQQVENRYNIDKLRPQVSKPDFNRPDKPDTAQQDFKQPQKQIKPTYDFGKPGVPDQYKPSNKAVGKTVVVKAVKPDISKPDFNRPDKSDTSKQDYKQPQIQIKSTFDFGKPDVPDQYKTNYDSAGKPVVKYNKPDVSKPDFNRPDKPDAANQGNYKQMKVSSVSYDFSQIDKSSQFQQKYQQGDNRNTIGLQKPDISKPDFNRPDQPDITKQDYKTPAKLIKPTYDFGKPDVPVQYKPSLESAGKRFVVKPGMPDISKPDFNRPDKPDTTKQDYKQPQKQTKPAYDFGKPDVPDQFKPSYKSNGIRIVETPMKPDISKPDFNKPDKLDTTKQDYKQPQTKVKPTYDFGKPDQPDQNKPNYQSAGKPVVKYNKPDVSKPDFNRPDSLDASIKGYNNQPKVDSTSYDLSSIDKSVKVQQSYKKDVNRNTKGLYKFDISKPDFNRPDQPDFNMPDKSKPNFNKPDKLDTSQQVYKQPQKQIKPTYDFGRPDVPDQIKPRYKSGGKTFVLNKVKSDISKPDFNRPDKPDTLTQGNNQQPEPTMTSYEFRKIDQTVQTRQNYQQGENRYNIDKLRPQVSKPDFNRPYDFGKPDVPAQKKPSYESAGKRFVVKAGMPDISKPDFNRPDKPDTTQQDYKQPLKQIKPAYDFGKPDVPDQNILSYKSGGKTVVMKPVKPGISKPDFNRPDKPDTSKQVYKQPQTQVKPAFDFGKPDVPDQNKPNYQSAGKLVVKYNKPDVSKPDFNRPDSPDSSIKGYNNKLKVDSSSYDFSSIDKSVQFQQSYKKDINRNTKGLYKFDITKPDFNRPDQPDFNRPDQSKPNFNKPDKLDTSQQVYKQPQKQIKPTYDFGRPDVPDQIKPSYKSGGKTFVLNKVKSDISKPDFNRPDKPDTQTQGNNMQPEPAMTSYEFKKIDQSGKTQQDYQQGANSYNMGQLRSRVSKPDFNRPDQPDKSQQDYKQPQKLIKPAKNFGKPDVPDQYKPSYKSTGNNIVVKAVKSDISKPDFNRPDKPDTSKQDYIQPRRQVKPIYDFGKPDAPDQSKPSYISGGKTFVMKAVKPDIVKSDFNRPNKPDTQTQLKSEVISKQIMKVGQSVKTQQNYQQNENRYNIGLQKPEMSKPDFNRPDQPDVAVEDYRSPKKQKKPSYDFGKPDVPVQYIPNYQSAGKPVVVKPGKPEISKPDFNRPDQVDTIVKGYKSPTNQKIPTYDFGKPDVPDQYKPKFESAGKVIVKYGKPDMSKPDFNRPDKPDTLQQDYKQPQKQVKPTYNFGKPDVSDQNKPNYISAVKPVVKYSKPDISKPDFNRPDNPDASVQRYEKQINVDSSSYDISRIDKNVQTKRKYQQDVDRNTVSLQKPEITKTDFNRPDQPDAMQKDYKTPVNMIKPTYDFGKPDVRVQYQPSYVSAGKRVVVKPGMPDLSKPDFNRPDKPDTTQQNNKQAEKQIKPSYDFGKPDVPDQRDPSYKSGRRTFVLKEVKSDISRPDFNRPDKPDTPIQGYNKQPEPAMTSYKISKIDQTVKTEQNYQQGENRYNIGLQKPEMSKPDFNRPDQPDITVQDYISPTKQIKPSYDFVKPDVPDQYIQNYKSDRKPAVVKPGKPDISKPDFNRPDQVDTTVKGYISPTNQKIPTYDFGKPDVPDQYKPKFESAGKVIVKYGKPDMSNPDFNRPDNPDTPQQDNKQPQKQIKPTYVFGKPDVSDQNKPNYISAVKPVVKYNKPDISKPDFNRPDNPDTSVQGYEKQINVDSYSYDISRIDKNVQTKRKYPQDVDRNTIRLQKPEITKTDFNRPDQPDAMQKDYKTPVNMIKPTYDFGKPDVRVQYQPSYVLAGKRVVVKPGMPDLSKPDFNRPDKPDTTQQNNKQAEKQIKPVYDFGKPNVPDQRDPSYKSGRRTFVLKAVKSDISRPDFNRPDKPDTPIQGYNKQPEPAINSYKISKIDQTVKTEQNYQQGENRYNIGLQKTEMSKPDFNRPDQPDITVQDYISPTKQIKPSYDFVKPDVPDQYIQNYQSARKPAVVKPGKPDISKPDFNRPDQVDTTVKGYRLPTNQKIPTYDFGKPDVPDQYKPRFESAGKVIVKYGKPDMSKPDFNKPDKPDTSKQNNKKPQKQVKPTYDIGKPVVPDQSKPNYESAGKPVVKYNKPDISTPDFNRPDKLDSSVQGYKQQINVDSPFYDISKIDKSVKTKQKYQQDVNRNTIGLQKVDIVKTDFNRPDQPDANQKVYKAPVKMIKQTYDFGKPDVLVQYKPSYKSAGKRFVVKPGMPDTSKPDFNRPDQPDTSQQDYKQPQKQIKSAYDFGKPDVPDQYKPSYKSIGNNIVVKAVKGDISKPDFNRQDKLYTSQQDYTQPQIQVKPTYDFGKPNVPDQNKPSYKSGGKTFVVKAVKADISQPDFYRPDKPDTSVLGYNKQTASSYDFNNLDQSVQTYQSSQQIVNRNNKGQQKYDISNVDFNRPDQTDAMKQNYKIPAKQDKPTFNVGLPDVPDQYKPRFKSAKTPVIVNSGKPDFNRPDKVSTSQQNYKQPQKQEKPYFGRSNRLEKTKPSYNSAGNTFVVKAVKPDISKSDFNRPVQPSTSTQGYKNIFDQAATLYESNIKQSYNTRQKGKIPAEKRINLNSFKDSVEPAISKTGIERPVSNQVLRKSKNELNFQNLNQESANLVLNALKKLRLLSSNNAKSGQQYETGQIVLNNRNTNQQTDIAQNSIQSNGQEGKIQTNYANWQLKEKAAGSKQAFNIGMDEKPSSTKAMDVYNAQSVKLQTKLKSGKPFFSERKDATKQGVLLKDLPVIRDNYTPDKIDNNNSPNVNGGAYSKTSQNIDKSVKQVVEAKPYSSYSGTTSRQDLGAILTPSADLGSTNNKQIGTSSGMQEKPAGQQQNNIAYDSSKSQPADLTGGSKVNCSVISPCCGDDDYTYLSECFLPPNVKKVCDGFCPCPAPGQPSGPATWLVPRTSSENSISKSSSFIKTPSAQPSVQMPAENKQNTPIVASQNDDNEASQGVDYQSTNIYSAAAKQSAYNTLTNNLCALKCKGAKRNPVCTTAGITLNKCIQKCRGAVVACEGACPCRPNMNVQANGRENKADNIAALRLLTNNNDDSTDTDGNDNLDPALKT